MEKLVHWDVLQLCFYVIYKRKTPSFTLNTKSFNSPTYIFNGV